MSPSVFRCPVCGGTVSKSTPDNHCCLKCGIRMNPFDYSEMEDLFSAMSTLRLTREYLMAGRDIRSIHPGVGRMFLLYIISNALNAYDRFRGSEFLVRDIDRALYQEVTHG